MKQIEVVAAVIRRGGEILATQRGYGDFKDWWEFPGGKIEAVETPQQALVREIRVSGVNWPPRRSTSMSTRHRAGLAGTPSPV